MQPQSTPCERFTWKRIVPKDDPLLLEEYHYMVEHCPDHDIIEDESGTYRWKPIEISRWLADTVNLDDMWKAYQQGAFTTEQFQLFYRQMGYSLCGYDEVWGDIIWPEDYEEE